MPHSLQRKIVQKPPCLREAAFCRSGIIQVCRRQGRRGVRRCCGEHDQNVSQMRRCVASESFRFCCRKCGYEGDADVADANNILWRGQRLRARGERLCTARAQVKRPSRKSRAGQQQKPIRRDPYAPKTHKDSAGNLRPSGRRGCQFASASTEPKVIFLPLQNKRTCIAESPMLECSSTHSLRGCAPQCGYVQMQVLQNFA